MSPPPVPSPVIPSIPIPGENDASARSGNAGLLDVASVSHGNGRQGVADVRTDHQGWWPLRGRSDGARYETQARAPVATRGYLNVQILGPPRRAGQLSTHSCGGTPGPWNSCTSTPNSRPPSPWRREGIPGAATHLAACGRSGEDFDGLRAVVSRMSEVHALGSSCWPRRAAPSLSALASACALALR